MPLEELSNENQLEAFKHVGFWKCMDTLKDKFLIEALVKNNPLPWINKSNESNKIELVSRRKLNV